jgi:hypothetical protein
MTVHCSCSFSKKKDYLGSIWKHDAYHIENALAQVAVLTEWKRKKKVVPS